MCKPGYGGDFDFKCNECPVDCIGWAIFIAHLLLSRIIIVSVLVYFAIQTAESEDEDYTDGGEPVLDIMKAALGMWPVSYTHLTLPTILRV